jgi:hypothetical protein
MKGAEFIVVEAISSLLDELHLWLGRNICEKGSILVGGGVIILRGRVLHLLWSKLCGQGRFLLLGGVSSIAGIAFLHIP